MTKKTKRIIALGVAALTIMAVLVTGCGNSNPTPTTSGTATSAPSIVLKFGEINPETHPMVQGMKEFARIVKEKTNGRIQVQIFAGGQLGDEKTEMQSLQMGALDMFRANSMTLADFGADKMMVFSLPYIFTSSDQMWKVLDGPIGQQMLQSVQDKKIKMVALGYFEDGSRNFFGKKPINSIADVKGLKIRVPQDQIMMEMVKAFGASPTPTAYNELYSAMQTGVVDAAENTIAGYTSMSFFEVGKYLTLDAHSDSPGVITMSQQTWDKLSDADKKIVKDAVLEASQFERKVTQKGATDSIAQLKAKGVTIIDVPDKTAWQNAVAPVYAKYASKYQDIIDSIKATK